MLVRRRWLLLGLTVVFAAGPVLFTARASAIPSLEQAPERFWIAARYDATHLVAYFETVRFGTLPTRDNQFVQARTPDFFGPRPIATAELERVRPAAGEPFQIGDRYDVLTADGGAVTMTLASFVKFHSDESVGNDSYIGALGRVAAPDLVKLRGNYFVVRRRDSAASVRGNRAGLGEVRFPPPGQIPKLLEIVGGAKLIASQIFTTAAGDTRQVVMTTIGTGRGCRTRMAWLTGQPESRVVGTEDMPFCGSTLYAGLNLRAAVDLGNGRTGLVIVRSGSASREVRLVEYLEGAKLADMRVWQRISVGD